MEKQIIKSRLDFFRKAKGKWEYKPNEVISEFPSFEIFISPKPQREGISIPIAVNMDLGSGMKPINMIFFWINAHLNSSNKHFNSGYFDYCAETEKLAFYQFKNNMTYEKLFDFERAQ